MATRSWPRVTLPAEIETVVTDGGVLAVIVGLDDIGRYILEDCHTDLERDRVTGRTHVVERRFPVTAAVLVRDWGVVRVPAELTAEEAAVAA